jgi:hypothetical protein
MNAKDLSDPLNLGDFRLNYMCKDLLISIEDAISGQRGSIKLRPSTAAAFEALCRTIKNLDEVTSNNLR